MINLIEQTIEKFNMLEYGDNVIVALSGGADSVCLLHNLNSIKEKYNLNLMACHVNHNLRGKESDKDMKFCMELCKQNDIEIFVKNVDVDALSKEQRLSHEECGRNVRYEFFNSLSEKYNAKIATAHNADDNTETVIYNMTRGASLKGLSGIPKVRGKIIRPLIFSTRAEIEEYCQKYRLVYMTDSTNLTDEYTRNKIRHNVIPVLKEINPSVHSTILRMNSTLSEISEYLEKSALLLLKIAKCKDGYLAHKLQEANTVVLKEAISILFAEKSFTSYTGKQIEETISVVENGGKINIKKNLSAVNKQGVFRIVNLENDDFYSRNVVPEKPVVYKNRLFTLDNVKVKGKFSKYTSGDYISSDIISDNLTLRNRLAGDSIKLYKRGVTKSLKKLMNEMKIPEEQRDRLLVLASGNEVFWVEGIGISENAAVKETDTECLKIVFTEL